MDASIAFWTAIGSLILAGLGGFLNTFLTWKAGQNAAEREMRIALAAAEREEKAADDRKATAHLMSKQIEATTGVADKIDENTGLTKDVQKSINGRVDQLIDAAKSAASPPITAAAAEHAAGLIAVAAETAKGIISTAATIASAKVGDQATVMDALKDIKVLSEENKKIGKINHEFLNSRLEGFLQKMSDALQFKADTTKDQVDIDAAMAGKKELTDHQAQQAEVDKMGVKP
jgi:hypothetical protein